MARIQSPYLNFDVRTVRAEASYRAHVDSPGGQAVVEFDLALAGRGREDLLRRLGLPEGSALPNTATTTAAASALGRELFAAVFAGEVLGCLRASIEAARARGARLRIRLRLTDTPELVALPWEFLYNPSLRRFLALSIETPLVRFLDLAESVRPLAIDPPLRVLVMIPSPSDHVRPVDRVREWANLDQALSTPELQGRVVLDLLERGTLAELRQRLRQNDYHAFHFIGHGAFNEERSTGTLILEDSEQRFRRVSGQDLATILHNHASLRLSVLHSCEAARSSRVDPFIGTAQELVQQGIPAVIAMQFPITMKAAAIFSRELYAAVSDGYPVDAAVTESRSALRSEGNEAEWGTPVLYMRSLDGVLFTVEQQQARNATLFEQASKSGAVTADAGGSPEGAEPVPTVAPQLRMGQTTSPRQLRVFLSYSSRDKDAVRGLYQRLSAEEGVAPWLDEEALLPGQDWQRETRRAVRASDVFVVCLSRAAVSSAGFLHKEIRYALDVAEERPDGAIFIIPVRLEACDVPDLLDRYTWVNYYEPDGYERLTRTLGSLKSAAGPVASEPQPP